MESLFLAYITLWKPLGYIIVFLGTMVEGDIFLLTTAAITRLGYLDPVDALITVCAGVLVGDTLWFLLGKKSQHIKKPFVQKILSHIHLMPIDVHSRFFYKLLLSKFMYGTHHPFVFSAGVKGVPLGVFLRNQIPAALIWIATIGGLGYGLATFLVRLKHYVKFVEIGLVAIVVTYLIMVIFVRKNLPSKTPSTE